LITDLFVELQKVEGVSKNYKADVSENKYLKHNLIIIQYDSNYVNIFN
jgi:hypothetical protein